MEKTIFEKIIDREIPASIVYEDDNFLSFLDIQPVNKGHLLIVTKKPYRWMQDVPDDILSEAFVLTKKIMSHMIKVLGCDFVQVGVVGKDVPHFHIHLIPRMLSGDDVNTLSAGNKYKEGEMQTFAEKLKIN